MLFQLEFEHLRTFCFLELWARRSDVGTLFAAVDPVARRVAWVRFDGMFALANRDGSVARSGSQRFDVEKEVSSSHSAFMPLEEFTETFEGRARAIDARESRRHLRW